MPNLLLAVFLKKCFLDSETFCVVRVYERFLHVISVVN